MLFSLACWSTVGGLLFLVFPETWSSSAIGDALPFALERAWALLFLLGGLLVLAGMWRLDARFEVGGLLALAACYSTYFFALITERQLSAVVISAPVFLALATGATARAIVLSYEPKGAPWRRRT
jgi:hypothetical protein